MQGQVLFSNSVGPNVYSIYGSLSDSADEMSASTYYIKSSRVS